MNLVKQVVKWSEERRIFSRKRKSNQQRALGVLIYYANLSYEKAGFSPAQATKQSVNGGTWQWYPWTPDQASFRRCAVVSFEPRSAIERLFGDIEWRIRKFWNDFIGKYSRESMERWIRSFTGFKNWMKDSKGALI